MDAEDLKKFNEEDRQELLDAETRMYSHYFEGSEEDKKPAQIAFLVAMFVHVFILYVTFPEFSMSSPVPAEDKVVYVQTWRPPPPPQKEPPKPIEQRKQKTKKIPIPDPTPEEPEPIIEPEPEPEPEPLPPDMIALIGTPAPPPIGNTGPLIAGVGGVSNPVLLDKIQPLYPDLARKAGIQGKVFLQATVSKAGDVINVAVVSCTAPKLGFEEAALAAVRKWKYKPGEQNGQPVDVYFNVSVDFTIQ
jgi:TonB family protein